MGSGPSIDQVDLPAYLLASYKSVAEVKAAIDGGLTATWNSALNIGSIIINGAMGKNDGGEREREGEMGGGGVGGWEAAWS